MFCRFLRKLFRLKQFEQPGEATGNTSVETNGANEEDNIQSDTNSMNSTEEEKENTDTTTPEEFLYLRDLISYRLKETAERPPFPSITKWRPPIRDFIKEHKLEQDEDACSLLIIGLASHAMPELFGNTILESVKSDGELPQVGGVRGKNSRGVLPTGQTALFLLAGDDWEKRNKVERLFWSDQYFSRNRILWLEDLPLGEPVMSGKIIMPIDYIDQILFGTSAPPHFSSTFPANRIETKLQSSDIVMNKDVKRHYLNLLDWIIYNPPFMDVWGMEKRIRKGFRVLFYGPPGTGKTLTANVLGNETGRPVYKIDLSTVVSKYIGETEKNLELLFARAQDKNWILFFDEADAIFGKRTNVRDAHDKYANQEVSYLLQRIEEFGGLVILATNMKSNIDDAFIRRFNDIVKFTIPNEDERKEIWERSFPEKSSIDDIPNKVKKYELTGGNIINVIHFAGIQAVKRREDDAGTEQQNCKSPNPDKLVFYLEDVLEGIRREMIKEGKPFNM